MGRTTPLPDTMSAEEKDAYRYGWRRGRTVCLDTAELRYQGASHTVRTAFYDGYDDRSLGYDFGATPRGLGPE